MGGGASLEGGIGTERDQYYCYSCRRIFSRTYTSPEELTCPLCNSAFVEEVQGIRQHDFMPVRRGMGSGSQLTAEQSRRFTNATNMLRFLETQLREELEQLQLNFEAGHALISDRTRNGAAKLPPKLSKIMIGKLRSCILDLDLVCSQPSCPICSEDFVVDAEEAKLPCGHLYHRTCVIPWLESKQNCPICRTELTNDLPELADLERLPMKDLNNWLEIMSEECSSPSCSGHKKADGGSSGGAEPTAVPKDSPRWTAGDSKQADAEGGEGKEGDSKQTEQDTLSDEQMNSQHRTILAAKLLKRLQAYEEWRTEAVRLAEEEQRSLDAARQAQLNALDNHMTNILSFNTPGGRALLTAASIQPSLAGGSPSSGSAGTSGNARSPGAGAPWRSRLISPAVAAAADGSGRNPFERSGSGESFLSPSRMAASLRQGLFPSSLGRSDSSDGGVRGSIPSHAVTGITRLSDGTEVRHRIRILGDDEDSSSGDDDSESSEADAGMQALYRQANASHLAQYAGTNSVRALSAASQGGSGYFVAPTFSGVGASVGSALQRMGLHRAHSETVAHTGAGHLQAHSLGDSYHVQRAFHRAMHPEDDHVIDDPEQEGDWARELAQLGAGSDSGRMRRSGFNGISSRNAGLAAEDSDDIGEGGESQNPVEAVLRSAQQHDQVRATAAPHAPILSAPSSSGRHGSPSDGAEANDAGNIRTTNVSNRVSSSSQRVSAIDRYMTLTAPELFGTSERSSNAPSTSAGASDSAGGSLGTTYQVRATGGGSYATVPVRNTAGSELDGVD